MSGLEDTLSDAHSSLGNQMGGESEEDSAGGESDVSSLLADAKDFFDEVKNGHKANDDLCEEVESFIDKTYKLYIEKKPTKQKQEEYKKLYKNRQKLELEVWDKANNAVKEAITMGVEIGIQGPKGLIGLPDINDQISKAESVISNKESMAEQQ
jgi:hypothetical protein